MRLKSNRQARGFTLIETIITLTVTAVLATMIFTYFGEAFLQSITPITRLKNAATLQNIMENITADYNVYPKWRSGTVYTNANYVIPTNFNGHYYKCSTATGTSGAAEPTNWPLNSGGAVTDNTVTWVEIGRLRTLRSLTALQTSIGTEGTEMNNTYGKYHVVRNRFTRFVSDVDQDADAGGANTLLKVTLRNNSGETQTALFVSD
jgi:prepilin-type N-terminal cleavage/methylation domain-containing protein